MFFLYTNYVAISKEKNIITHKYVNIGKLIYSSLNQNRKTLIFSNSKIDVFDINQQ